MKKNYGNSSNGQYRRLIIFILCELTITLYIPNYL